MAAYQSQASDPTLEPAGAGRRLRGALEALEPGDLYVSLQAHPGRPEVLTTWLDPSVTDEADPLSRDPSLDMYEPDNAPPYPEEFVARYRHAQVERNARITQWVRAELDRLERAGAYDRNFNVHRTWADLRFMDPAIDPSERPPARCLAGDPAWANSSPFGIAASSSLRTWLSMWSLRDSQCRGAPHLPHITVPALVIQSTADVSVFPSDARAIFDSSSGSTATTTSSRPTTHASVWRRASPVGSPPGKADAWRRGGGRRARPAPWTRHRGPKAPAHEHDSLS
jgi:hypothetical protein